ncbi:MAG: hypothetical protein PVJ51_04625 [Acidobacteriota bacterium]|jgi:hypothetical protein
MHKPLLARMSLLSLLTAVLLLPIAAANAQEGPQGVWEGAIDVPGQPLGVIVTLRSGSSGAWSGTIDIPSQNLTEFPLSDVTVDGDAVSFAMNGVPGNPVFSGTWNAAEASIRGNFGQGGGSFPFSLDRTGDAPMTDAGSAVDADTAAKVVGTWNGTLSGGGGQVRLVFHIAYADGALGGTMDSPDQGQTGLQLTSVSFDGTTFRADLSYAGAYFEGTLSNDGASIVGNWNQGGGAAPLTVEKQ